MAEEVDIKKQTNSLQKEIDTLKGNKTKYKNMNKKIEEAIVKLKKAKSNLNTACDRLNKNYVSGSKAEMRKRTEWQKQLNNEIDRLIKKLSGTILPESKRQIGSIGSKVTDKSEEMQKLKQE